MAAKPLWVLLAYRLPREPSTPRIAVWRRLRQLGAVQIGDGLVALPLDERTREQLEWLAQFVEDADGEASVWISEPTTAAQQRALATRMTDAVVADYQAVIDAAQAARVGDANRRRRTHRRDYAGLWTGSSHATSFLHRSGAQAERAVSELASLVEEVR